MSVVFVSQLITILILYKIARTVEANAYKEMCFWLEARQRATDAKNRGYMQESRGS